MPSDACFFQAVYQNSCNSEESQAYASVRDRVMGVDKTLKVFLEKVAVVALAALATAIEDCTLKTLPLGIPFHPYLPWVSLFQRWRSVWVHHYSLQAVFNHKCRQCILWIYWHTVKKKKNDKKKLLKESQIDIPFGAGGQLRSQREGDLESCLDFVQKSFHPRLMVLKWSHILNLFFFNLPSKSQEEQMIKE